MPKLPTQSRLDDTAIATIVSGFARRSDVSIDDILTLVERLKSAPTPTPAKTVAAPRVRTLSAENADRAVSQDLVYCLCCGKGFKMLKRHIGAEHGLTEAEYRVMFDLPADTPLVAPSYSKRKAEYAKRSGLGKHSRDNNNAEAS